MIQHYHFENKQPGLLPCNKKQKVCVLLFYIHFSLDTNRGMEKKNKKTKKKQTQPRILGRGFK